MNVINNTSTGNLYAISIISTMGDNNTINFSLCSIITNKVNIVLGCQYAVHVYLDNCTLINPDAHTLFVAKNGNAYITASNCYTNSYPESASTKYAPADAIKFENIKEVTETKIINCDCHQISQIILSIQKRNLLTQPTLCCLSALLEKSESWKHFANY